ncbi:MAG: hypothetical protein WB870_07390 [Gallionellaceae bacterium]
MKKLLLSLIITLIPSAYAADWEGVVENSTELLRLPRYCWGTQQINKISGDHNYEQYLAIYGNGYGHLHHYCWALNLENSILLMDDKLLRESKFRVVLSGIQYSLDRAQPGFVFLPDMYTSKARILFTMHRDDEAAVALKQAIQAKPDYVFAILRLSDYFVDKGDKAEAIRVLEEGIDNTEKATALISKLGNLGKTYQGTPGSARKKEEDAKDQIVPLATEANQSLEKQTASSNSDVPPTTDRAIQQTQPLPADSKPANNPYCRFCP